MPDTGEHTVLDPRRTDGAELDVEFDVESYGSSDSYWEPGDPPEISITATRDFTGANVFDLLTDEQQEKVHAQIIWEYDFDPGDPFPYD